MAKLKNYNGSIELISGLTGKNGQDIPLMEAHSVMVKEDGTRLDEELLNIATKLGILESNIPDSDGNITNDDLINAINSYMAEKLGDYASKTDLAAVATSGSYNDLLNKPTLFSGKYDDLSGKPALFSGDYNDLSNQPVLFSGSYNDLSDKPDLSNIGGGGVSEDRVKALIAEANYKPIEITSFSASPSVIEKGNSTSVTLTWRLSKKEESQTINLSTVTNEIRSKTYTSVSTNTTYTLRVTEKDGKDGTKAEASRSCTVYAAYPFFYGWKTSDSIASTVGLTKDVKATINNTYDITLTAAGYLYFVFHADEDEPTITDAKSLQGVDYAKQDGLISYNGYSYKIYRSVKLNAGTYKIKVEV